VHLLLNMEIFSAAFTSSSQYSVAITEVVKEISPQHFLNTLYREVQFSVLMYFKSIC